MNKYSHSHNSINGNTGCIGPKVCLFILVVGLLIFGCKNEPKVDETIPFTYDSTRNFLEDYNEGKVIRGSTNVINVDSVLGPEVPLHTYSPIPRKKGKMKKPVQFSLLIDTSGTYISTYRRRTLPQDTVWQRMAADSSRYWFIRDYNMVRVEGDHMARMNFPDSSITIQGDTMKLIRYLMNEVFRKR